MNQGADLIAGKGMREAIDAAKPGFGVFAALSGGWSRYNSGSQVDISGFSLLTGLSFGAALSPGCLTLGAFFEYGNGSYDTYTSFNNAADVNGDGNIRHIGGGVLGRMEFVNSGPGLSIWKPASGRASSTTNTPVPICGTFSPAAARTMTPVRRMPACTSARLSLEHRRTSFPGQLYPILPDAAGRRAVTLSTGDEVKFGDVHSPRLRVGSRFSYAVNEYASPYIGTAWEHEFGGRVKATTYGYDISKPDLMGSTGIGELGLTLKPSQTLALSFDLGVQGYTGLRQGVTGSVQVKWEF